MRTLEGLRSWTLSHGAAALFFALCVNGCFSDSSPYPVEVCQPEEPTAHPPAPPDAGNPGSGDNVMFAIRNLSLGYEGADGTWSKDAWASYGYDLDGMVSPGCPSSHCKYRVGATSSQIQTDGPGGLDNSFGSNVMPIFHGLASDYSTQVRESIQRGDHTLLRGREAGARHGPAAPSARSVYGLTPIAWRAAQWLRVRVIFSRLRVVFQCPLRRRSHPRMLHQQSKPSAPPTKTMTQRPEVMG